MSDMTECIIFSEYEEKSGVPPPSSVSGPLLNFLCFCMAVIRQLIHLERGLKE